MLKTYTAGNNPPGWFTCFLCGITYPVLKGERPHCTSKVAEAHWLTRYILGAMYGQEDAPR